MSDETKPVAPPAPSLEPPPPVTVPAAAPELINPTPKPTHKAACGNVGDVGDVGDLGTNAANSQPPAK